MHSSYFCTTLLNSFDLFSSIFNFYFANFWEISNIWSLNPESDFVLGRDGLLFVQLQLVPLLRFAMREACIAFQTEERGALDIFGVVCCRVLSCAVVQTGSMVRATSQSSQRGCDFRIFRGMITV